MVQDDNPTAAASIQSAISELIRQMRVAAASVQACTVTATAAAFSTPTANNGNGVIAVSTKRGDGLVQENLFPETAYILCTQDSQTGGATRGQEQFTYYAQTAITDVWSNLYPGGAGGTQTLSAIDASVYQTSTGNMLNNGDFELFTTNTPNQWTVLVGTPGTDFAKDTGTVFDGSADLKFIGGTAVQSSIAQTFNSGAGSTVVLQPDTVYAVNYWVKADVVPASGVLTLDLVDGTNTTINDDQATANTFALTLSGISTSYVAKSTFFRTPRALPATQKLRVRISTVIPGGSNIFFDRLSMTPATTLYPGGPMAAIFSGQTTAPFIANTSASAPPGTPGNGDGFILTATNNYGGASNLSTWQQLFERLFGMRALGLVLPSSGGPTIADSLIST
jgi:hypothetical protein